MNGLTGKVAIITGAASGTGAEHARHLLGPGDATSAKVTRGSASDGREPRNAVPGRAPDREPVSSA